MAESAWIFDVNDADFEQKVIEQSRRVPVVFYFWATWCGPCQRLGPLLERLVDERQGEVLLAKLNVDESQQVAGGFGISSIPAVMAFRDGKMILDFVGLLPDEQLREFIDRVVPSETDKQVQHAASIESSDPDQAESIYRQILEQDRGHESATLGLARLLVAQKRDEEAKTLLENIAAGEEYQRLESVIGLRESLPEAAEESDLRSRLQSDPDNAELHFELGAVLANNGQYEEALKEMFEAGQRDKELCKEKVREAMVNIFKIIGVRNPLSDEYRSKLAKILY